MEIYSVKVEINDKGWRDGNVFFTCASDAVKHMRKFIAQQIWDARSEGRKVEYLCTFKDTAMESQKNERPATQTISFRITAKNGGSSWYEYRVWATEIHDKGEYFNKKRFYYHWL